MLSKKGHRFLVDGGPIGRIMLIYTLSVGRSPFETSCLKLTYFWIKKNVCRIPEHINPVATSLFQKMPQTGRIAHLIIHEQLKTSSLLLATSQPISHYLPHHSIKVFNRSQKPGSQQQEATHSPK